MRITILGSKSIHIIRLKQKIITLHMHACWALLRSSIRGIHEQHLRIWHIFISAEGNKPKILSILRFQEGAIQQYGGVNSSVERGLCNGSIFQQRAVLD